MSELLSEQELRNKVYELRKEVFTNIPERGVGEALEIMEEQLYNLIQSQKIAHANMVTGEDDEHTQKCKDYGNTMQIDKFCICTARQTNLLLIRQRGRNKV